MEELRRRRSGTAEARTSGGCLRAGCKMACALPHPKPYLQDDLNKRGPRLEPSASILRGLTVAAFAPVGRAPRQPSVQLPFVLTQSRSKRLLSLAGGATVDTVCSQFGGKPIKSMLVGKS